MAAGGGGCPGARYHQGPTGGALAGVLYAMAAAKFEEGLASLSQEHGLTAALGKGGYGLLGCVAFAVMGGTLYWASRKSTPQH